MSLDTAVKLTRRRVLGFALEVTTGTPVIPTGADAVTRIFDPDIKYETEKVERESEGASFSPIIQYVGARAGSASFESELVGNGGSGTAQWSSRLLLGCGMQATAGAYTFLSGANQTLTICEWRDGKRYGISGAMGTAKITCKRGQKGRIKWDFKGVQMPVIDASNPTPTYSTIVAPRIATAFTIGGTTYRVPDIEYDLGNKVELREDILGVDANSESTGYRCAYIQDRQPMVRVAPEAVSVATYDWRASFNALTTLAIIHTVGDTANNIISFSVPAAQLIEDPNVGDRSGLMTEVIAALMTRATAAGEDEFSMTFS